MNGAWFKNQYKKHLALTISAVLFSSGGVLAAEADFGSNVDVMSHQVSWERERTSEEWARLRDNMVEWDEIRDLVHEYNPTVSSLWLKYRENDKNGLYNIDYEKTLEQISEAYVASLDAADGSALQEALAEMQFDVSMASATIDSSAQTTDKEAAKLQIEQSELTVTETIRKSIINMYIADVQRQIDELTANYDQTLYDAAVRKQALGQATQLDVLSALETLDNAKLKLAADDAAAEKTKQLLRVNLGWKYDSNPDICQVPMVSGETVDAINLDADTAEAISSNFAIAINERKRKVSESASQIENLTLSIENGKENVKADMLARFQALQQARNSLNQAMLALSNNNETLAKVQLNYSLGSASARNLESAQYGADVARLNAQIADYNLAMAYYDYLAGKNGLASAGS